jgi:phosphonoacetate hydrolase
MSQKIEANGRHYAAPTQPTIVICLDGFDPDYLNQGITDGTLPTLAGAGFIGTARASVPTTTNTNNTSIVTGVPPPCMASTAITTWTRKPARRSW